MVYFEDSSVKQKRSLRMALAACVIAATVVLCVASHYWGHEQPPPQTATELAPGRDIAASVPFTPAAEPSQPEPAFDTAQQVHSESAQDKSADIPDSSSL